MIQIAILSRNKNLHSVRRLLQEARKVGVKCDVINPLECQLIVENKSTRIVVGSRQLPHYDAILPRIGASITEYGLAVVKQFESIGSRVVNGSDSIANSRDKMKSLQILSAAGLKVPATVLLRSQRSMRSALHAVKGMPVVLKVLQGTQGVGVMIVHSPVSLRSVLDTLHGLGQDVLMQQFIAEGAGSDYRVFVVGQKVVAAMMRTAAAGEFRSNIHRGGEGKLVKLAQSYQRVAIRAAQVLGLQVAGVDLMSSNEGPLILEVNSSPGFEGIEHATGLNIGSLIMKQLVQEARRRGKKR